MKNLIFLFLLIFPGISWGLTYFDINVTSLHSRSYWIDNNNDHIPFNENNAGLGLTHELSKHKNFELKGGFYDNSYHKISLYGLLNFKHTFYMGNHFYAAPGVAVGAVSGYKGTYGDYTRGHANVEPVILSNVSVGTEEIRLNVGYVPKVRQQNISFLTFQLELKY